MWCIGALTEEYRDRMYALLELYARPMSKDEPVICIDEKSLQLIAHSRDPLPMTDNSAAKDDYEYVRNGTTNFSSLSSQRPDNESSRSLRIGAKSTSLRSSKTL
jgi:hypothetical protein